MAEKIRASIVGASGYVGGELLRLLLDHPNVEVQQVTSERNAGAFVHFTHPNLRGRTKLKFVSVDELEPCDLLFLGLPHGGAMGRIEHFSELATRIVDLSADFRLRNPDDYVRWYGKEHADTDVAGALCLWTARTASRGDRRGAAMSAASAATPRPPIWPSIRSLPPTSLMSSAA